MKKLVIFLTSLMILISITIFLDDNSQISVEEWEINRKVPKTDLKQVEGWGWKAVHNPSKNNIKRKVKVAIIDSGIDTQHNDLTGLVTKEYNAIEEGKKIIDDSGHGTSVAGIIGAIDNDYGIKGIAPSKVVDIYSVKAFENNTSTAKYLEKAFEWAINQNVDLINLSAGTNVHTKKLSTLIEKATDKNIIIIAAAGNSFDGKVKFPASSKKVISVGAVNYNLKQVSGTSKGKIDFVGPGTNILTTLPKNSYGFFGYTSSATAFVTAVYLNKISSYPDKSNYNYKTLYDEFKKKAIYIDKDEKVYGQGFIQN
ncbi:S8 family serine peptidase [Exiguobacterium sp. RIT341]|uniref:S8 family peptidase n=1 Tax=Exiguobacterium sp. RIT341 TaxID=1470592 RepID=UPI00045091A7|nr:S8 family serine peptidase [Exiguobacterium sp. RIT341]EZP58326.1 M-protease domain protein [Exiguobacterium sp. RIT341]